jgi:pimeloyl-ACP methyl ester carboxylesterase
MGFAKSLGHSKFHLVGHDWGAGIGWKVVADHPESILSWTALSVPHIQAFFEAIMTDEDQQRKSRYIKAFQWPVLPEMKIRSKDFALFRKLWNSHSEEEVQDYLSILRNKKALTAGLNYYRANYSSIKKSSLQQVLADVHSSTLFIWGKNDPALGRTCAERCGEYVKGNYQFMELDAGHWLVQTRYDEIKEALLKHLRLGGG